MEVVYNIYTTDASYFVSQVLETRPERATRKLAGSVLSGGPRFLPQPFVAYNATRGMFGGTKGSVALDKAGRIRSNFYVSVGDSTLEGAASVAGEINPSGGLLSHLEWSSGFSYAVLPVGTAGFNSLPPSSSNILKGATFWGRVIGAGRSLGSLSVIPRFGLSVEGGHRQSNLGVPLRLPEIIANASYGAVKAYGGLTFNHGRNAFAGSFGLQLGKAPNSTTLGYVKYVGDLGYRTRLLQKEHYPLRVDLDLGAGHMTHITAPVSLAERFFGGNVEQPFIDGDTWRIRRSPFIRGIPQNRLGYSSALGSFVGGTSFAAANLTVAPAVWAYPGIPAEIRHEPDFYAGMLSANNLVLLTSMFEYIARTSAFQSLLERLVEVDPLMADYEKAFSAILAGNPSDPIKGLIAHVNNLPDKVDERVEFLDPTHKIDSSLAAIRAAPKSAQARNEMRNLAMDPDDSSFAEMVSAANDVADALEPALKTTADAIRGLGTRLTKIGDALRPELDKVEAPTHSDPATLQPLMTQLATLEAPLKAIRDHASSLSENEKPDVSTPARSAEAIARVAISKIADPADSPRQKLLFMDDLLVGMGKVVPAVAEDTASRAEILAAALKTAGMPADAADLLQNAKDVRAGRQRLLALLLKFQRPPGERWAFHQTGYFRNTTDVLVREFNVAAVSPVLIYDTARLWAKPQARLGGFVHSFGFGGRFSLASADFTLGYAWAFPSRLGRGALFFSLDIIDLFR